MTSDLFWPLTYLTTFFFLSRIEFNFCKTSFKAVVLIRYKGICDNVWRHAGGGRGEASGSGPGHATGILASGEWGLGTAKSLTRYRTAPKHKELALSKCPECQDWEMLFQNRVKGDNDHVQSDQNKIQAISFETCN